MRLILFDIDGTLIRSNRAGRIAMSEALEEMFGTSGPLDTYHMSGKTDARIITDLLTAAGIAPRQIEENLSAVFELMAQKAETIYPARNMATCPGVPALLAELDRRPGALIGLLTGNARQTAPLKLRAAGIDPARFRVGAYGSESLDRNRLPAIAMQRAGELTGDSFSGENTVIVGDTPADILCARASKATAVAVASGWHSVSTLAQYHPDVLLENLANTPEVLKILLNTEGIA